MKTILCYGDSNTFGQVYAIEERFSREIRWTGKLQSMLGNEYYVVEEGLCGRTTVWDDPIEEYKNGKQYLIPCLQSHRPVDMVVLSLGTNDLKVRFSLTSFDIAAALENLVRTILDSGAGSNGGPPEVLMICPTPIRDVGNAEFNTMLAGGVEKSRALHDHCSRVAKRLNIHYLNPGEAIERSDMDGVHYTAKGHADFAKMVYETVKAVL